MNLTLATRKSPLALVQTHQVQAALQAFYPNLSIRLQPLSTKGDQIQDRSLADLGGKGLFIKALEEALMRGEADLAVHSLKDVPPVLDPVFTLAAVLPRGPVCDTLVSVNYNGLEDLPRGAVIGTSSVRRRAQLLHYRDDFEITPVRGNVQTRLAKLEGAEFDALILAEAGLERLGLSHYITQVLPSEHFLPSVGQGVLAIECLRSRQDLLTLLKPVNHLGTYACITAERSMNAHLGASCTSPVGSFAEIKDGTLILRGVVLSRDGKTQLNTLQYGAIDEVEIIGERAALDLLQQGATNIL